MVLKVIGPKDIYIYKQSIRTSCTPKEQYTTKRHTLEHTGDTLETHCNTIETLHTHITVEDANRHSDATACATHT